MGDFNIAVNLPSHEHDKLEEFYNLFDLPSFSLQSDDPNKNYSFSTREFFKSVGKHAPSRKKFIRGNHAPFMNEELR